MWKLKVKTDWMSDPITINADEVDFMHSPLVIVKGIHRELKSSSIIIPNEEDHAEFSQFETLILPYTSVCYAGEIRDQAPVTTLKRVEVHG